MRKLSIVLALLLALPTLMLAGGRLDKFGGQLNHKTGVYHFYKIDGKKLATPLVGENPNTNGGKIVYTGPPQYVSDKVSSSKPGAVVAAKKTKNVKKTKTTKKAKTGKKIKKSKKTKKAKKAKKVKSAKAGKAIGTPAATN